LHFALQFIKNGIPNKVRKTLHHINNGYLIGIFMLVSNILVTLAIQAIVGGGIEGDAGLFITSGTLETIAWIFVMFFIVGFSEELIFRGFLQRRIEIYFRTKTAYFRFWALIITSLIFAAIHLDLIGLPTRFVLGLFLGYLAQKRQYSILGPTIAHGFNNAIVVVLASIGF
jgi:membrane protease YdiL (CAAX protease family)